MAKERKRLINEDLVTDVGPGAVGGAVGVTGRPGRDNPGQAGRNILQKSCTHCTHCTHWRIILQKSCSSLCSIQPFYLVNFLQNIQP